uniref:Uncharacterized protein n=1 Tax=Panagrolaimus sp. PS1159 TaxID=55785 RepID=A0AC35G0X0_9BILA
MGNPEISAKKFCLYALDKAANDKRANFEWFKNARKSIEMAKSKSGSYDAEQIINTFIGAMPALRSGKFWGVLQILTRTKKLFCF